MVEVVQGIGEMVCFQILNSDKNKKVFLFCTKKKGSKLSEFLIWSTPSFLETLLNKEGWLNCRRFLLKSSDVIGE